MSSADLISGRDCKDVIVALDRSDVAEMLDGDKGCTGRRCVVFVGSSSSCDEDDQKDRDGWVVGCESDGGQSLKLLLDTDVVVSRQGWRPLALSLQAALARGDAAAEISR